MVAVAVVVVAGVVGVVVTAFAVVAFGVKRVLAGVVVHIEFVVIVIDVQGFLEAGFVTVEVGEEVNVAEQQTGDLVLVAVIVVVVIVSVLVVLVELELVALC